MQEFDPAQQPAVPVPPAHVRAAVGWALRNSPHELRAKELPEDWAAILVFHPSHGEANFQASNEALLNLLQCYARRLGLAGPMDLDEGELEVIRLCLFNERRSEGLVVFGSAVQMWLMGQLGRIAAQQQADTPRPKLLQPGDPGFGSVTPLNSNASHHRRRVR